MARPRLPSPVDEHHKAIRIDLGVHVAAHLRHEGISAVPREPCQRDIVH